MAEFECKECGAANPPNARFCGGCDAYLGWDSAPPAPSAAAAASAQGGSAAASAATTAAEDSRALPPNVKLVASEAVIEPDVGAGIEMQVRNNSTIVDAYRIDAVEAPEWLTIEQPEIRLMPGENQAMTATFKLVAGAFVEAQTIKLPLRICSLRDTAKFADANVMLTVPRYGPPVTIRTRPAVVRLVDETKGRVEVILGNSDSNYSRHVGLAGSDSEDVVRFEFNPQTVDIPAGKTATADVGFTVPPLQAGETRNRQLTISAAEEDNTAEATVAVTQECSEAVPLKLRLEPSVRRVHDCAVADVSLVIDNREGALDRKLRLEGRDPESALQFSFSKGEIVAPAGQMTTTRLSVSGNPAGPGGEVSRSFTVVAIDGAVETEASGTFVQISSDLPIKAASLRLAPERLHRRGSSGRFRVDIQNNDNSQWLNAELYGSDDERIVRFTFSPQRFEIPPGGSGWGWVGVTAPAPERGKEQSHEIEVQATDGRESVLASAVFVQSASDWIPILRWVLVLTGAVLVILGACSPWMRTVLDFWVTDLPRVLLNSDITDPNEKVQPEARAGIIVLAIMMAVGLIGKGAKATMSAAVLILLSIIGYLVWVSAVVDTGGPQYGAYLIVVGAVLGFIGGAIAKLVTRA